MRAARPRSSRAPCTCSSFSGSIVSYSASKSGRMYGSTFASTSPGRKPSRSPGLDRGTREDHAADLALGERSHGERDREVRLARARGADPERDGALADRVDVVLLRDGLRRDPLAAMRPDDVLEDVADVLGLVDRVEDRVDRAGADLLAALDELDELLDDRARLRDLASSPSSVRRLPRRLIVQPSRSRSAPRTPSPIPASSAATSFGTSRTSCTRSV